MRYFFVVFKANWGKSDILYVVTSSLVLECFYPFLWDI